MKNKPNRILIWSIIIFVLISIGIWNFSNMVSSGTHGIIGDYIIDKNKSSVQNKIDSLVESSKDLKFIQNDYSHQFDLKNLESNVTFTYKIRELENQKCTVMLIYIKKNKDEGFKSYDKLSNTEIRKYSNDFRELVLRPLKLVI